MRAVNVVWVVLLTSCALTPPAPPSPPRTTGLGLSFSRLELSNGLRVVVVTDPNAREVQVTMRYAVGGADDPSSQQGIAHLVEHLMFQQVLGSETVFAQLGERATYFNGTTTNDATTYVARAERAQLERLLSIEATRVGFRCTTITPAVFEREREVVVNELRYRDATEQLYNALMTGIYQEDHPYRRTVGGTAESVGIITFKDACAFADAHYTTTNGVLTVSGNVSPDEVSAALKPFLARIARRETAGIHNPIPRVIRRQQQGEIDAPIDDAAVMFSWALPPDPLTRVRVRAVAAAAVQAIDSAVDGRVHGSVIGDDRAPTFAIIIEPAEGETVEHVISEARKATDELPEAFRGVRTSAFSEIAFEKIQQTAIYQLYASLEDGGPRDAKLAGYVLAGRDPREALADEFRGLREMTPEVAAQVAADYISTQNASVVVVRPLAPHAGAPIALRPPVHAPGQRKDLVDLEAAHRPETMTPSPAAAVTTRRLPNGLTVVLVPFTTVPTVDIRLMFHAGAANERSERRGSALVAAHGLGWDVRYVNDLLRFFAAGGNSHVDVEADSTTFAVRGVDMHVDILLAALRRWVRDGTYDTADSVVASMRQNSKQNDDEGALTDAWRESLYGTHPYAVAGIARHASSTLTTEDGERFRSSYFTPDDATLVVSGHFDSALVNKWIDFLFSDWAGSAESNELDPVKPLAPASLALLVQGSTTDLRVAMQAMGGSHVQQLIATAMLDEIAQDVRHQLGAAYVIDAALLEHRYSAYYVLSGTVDASRTADAVALIRDRLAELRDSPEKLARAFVLARRRALTQVGSIGGSSGEIGDQIAHDLELGRAPLADRGLANEIAATTIEQMQHALEDLTLDRAVVLMRGTRDTIDPGFAALQRHPRYVMLDTAFDDDEPPAASQPARHRNRELPSIDEIEDALTAQSPSAPSTVAVVIGIGPSLATDGESSERVHPDCCIGAELSAFLGYRFDGRNAVGVQLAAGRFGGTYTVDIESDVYHYKVTPFDIAAATQLVRGRYWATLSLGAHFDLRNVPMPDFGTVAGRGEHEIIWNTGPAIGFAGGIDVVHIGPDALGVFFGMIATPFASVSHTSWTLGLAYRR